MVWYIADAGINIQGIIMKVLFAETGSASNRPADRLISLLNALQETNIDVELFCTSPSCYEGELSGEIKVHSPENNKSKQKKSIWSWKDKGQSSYNKAIKNTFARILEKSSFDLIHIVGFGDTEALLARQAYRREVPYAVHIWQWPKNNWKDVSALVDAKTVIVSYNGLKKMISRDFPEVYYRRYKTVPWPFIPPVQSSNEKSAPVSDEQPENLSHPVVLVGPFMEADGQMDALGALVAVSKSIPDIFTILTGFGSSDQIESRLPKENFKISKWEDAFNGERPASLFIQTPRTDIENPDSESADLHTLLFAMSQGLPVIVTDAAGMSDVILGTGAGAVISSGSEKDLTSAIEAYLSNPALLKKAGQASLKRIKNAYAPGSVAVKLIANYQELLTRK